MAQQPRVIPTMPEIGRPESFYAKMARDADSAGDPHMHEAAKVGQYVTLALDPSLTWEEKLKYFRHAIQRHCQPPPFPDDDLWMFYRNLADLIRRTAGQEVLRIASTEDDLYAMRISLGQTREQIENEAEQFFGRLMSDCDHCPAWFNDEDWMQLKIIRDQWI